MKKIFIVVLFIIFFTSILYVLIEVILRQSVGPDWDTIETKTIGTITRIDRGRADGAWFSYMSDGKLHEEFDGLTENGLTLGEKFWIKYCSSCSDVFFSKIKSISYLPVFTKDENYFETTAKITKIYSSGIEFIYLVGTDTKFERSQTLPPNYKDKYPNLKVGQEYKVRVWVVDFKRAIIDLDRPKIK